MAITPPSLHSLTILLSILLLLISPTIAKKSVYIIQMRISHKPATFSSAHGWYSDILKTISSHYEAPPKLIYTYAEAVTGFAAHLTEPQAARLRNYPSVLSVIRDEIVRPATTHTPTFMRLSPQSGLWPNTGFGSDIVIGVIDTGINPYSPSFNDMNMTQPPAKWKGSCETGDQFPPNSCNGKLIGARSFYKGYEQEFGCIINEPKSPRDVGGHGSFCSAIAGGSPVKDVVFNNYAGGDASGIAPMARIAMYKVFWGNPSNGSHADIVAAIDQAISDGVDVISFSASNRAMDYFMDIIGIAAFRAIQKGIVFVGAASNIGPMPSSVNNVAPWSLTVAASSIDRQFTADVVLGNGMKFSGSTLFDFSNTTHNSTHYIELVTGTAAGNKYCALPDKGQFNKSKVAGKMVICEKQTLTYYGLPLSAAVRLAGGKGLIAIDAYQNGEQLRADDFFIPGVTVTYEDGSRIKTYISSTKNPKAKIVFKGTVFGSSPSSPRIATFSARGPNLITPEIIKPDVTAPGHNIISAWAGGEAGDYSIMSGTSAAVPHISGVVALLKTSHPTWSPAAIKSAIMTTAYNLDSAGNYLIDFSTGKQSNPFDHGSGHIKPNKSVDPGLVYDLDVKDYISFFCSIGYDYDDILTIVQDSSLINCSDKILSGPGDLNYPSFSVIFKSNNDIVTYTRVVTNVGSSPNAVYQVLVNAPRSIGITVNPSTLVFSENEPTQTYNISFTSLVGEEIAPPPAFGSIVWSDGTHIVRSPIAAQWVKPNFLASI